MKKEIVVLPLVILLTLAGCAAFKKVARTVNEIATDLCWIAAEEHTDQLGGLAPAAWCAIKENIDPFIEEVLSAQDEAKLLTGLEND